MSRFNVLACVVAGVLSQSAPAGAQVTEARRIDGRENNAENPDWGAAGTPLLRMMPAAYPGDGSGDVILEFPERPNPREISNRLAAQDESIVNARRLTDMVWQWGQFIDHDIALTETAGESGTADIVISDPTDPLAPLIPFTRSLYDSQTGTAVASTIPR